MLLTTFPYITRQYRVQKYLQLRPRRDADAGTILNSENSLLNMTYKSYPKETQKAKDLEAANFFFCATLKYIKYLISFVTGGVVRNGTKA